MRYSQDGKYAIPYNGEEVYLHWANSDQYYIKTTETFNHYRFKTPNLKVHFEVKAEEMETEQNNNRGEEKYFIYLDSEYNSATKDLHVYFGYRPLTAEEQQEVLSVYNDHYRTASNKLSTFSKGQAKTIMNGYNTHKILENRTGLEFSSLKENHILKNGQPSDKIELEWHLHKYTAKNTSDYFIHKNLKAFLSRELDFYIKNEILHVDNILDEKDMHLEISRVRAFKKIALKIIAFLGEIEDFQKQLWLKKKFVVETNWCFTLDKIESSPNLSDEEKEAFYDQIRNNNDQVDEWIDLYVVDEIEGNLLVAGFDNPPSIKFLKENPYLMVDTNHFKENGTNEFKDKVLGIFDNIDEETDGCLIHSENFGALNNLQTLGQTAKKVKCVYIDPPYNTGNDGFIYKDSYQHSSWLSMMYDRLRLARNMLSDDGVIFISIDDHEAYNLKKICDVIFGENNFIAQLAVQLNPRGRNLDRHIAKTHESVFAYAISYENENTMTGIPKTGSMLSEYNKEDVNGKYRLIGLRNRNQAFNPITRPNLYFPLYVNPINKKVSVEKNEEHIVEVYPDTTTGTKTCWTWSKNKIIEENELLTSEKSGNEWRIYRKDYLISNTGEISRTLIKSFWYDKEINNDYGKKSIKELFGMNIMDFPKSPELVEKLLITGVENNGLIIDFFSGSGTTAHAVIELNRKNKERRKYIMIEMGEHFNTIIIPRLKKVVYTKDWKNGKPESRNSGISHMFKYQKLESYEDSLNNIDFAKPTDLVKDIANYEQQMFKFETKNSSVFLDMDKFKKPFDYRIKIEENDEITEVPADLVETFNYLAGIVVYRMYETEYHGNKYKFVEGEQNDKNVLVIWRNIAEDFSPEEDRQYLTQQMEKMEKTFDTVYMNGCPTIAEAVSIDTEFKEKMWQDGSDA